MKKLGNSMLLMLTALIWGIAFIAQSEGMNYVGPFTFNGIRSLLGGVVLIPFVFLLRKINKDRKPIDLKTLIAGGISCGVILFVASSLQQYALIDTSPGKAGFMTALYIVIVPLLGCFLGKKVGIKLAFAAVTALVGLYFLCFDGETLVFERGDILLILSAGMFSVHILTIDYFSPKTDGVAMSCIQFLVCGLLSVAPMIIFEEPTVAGILEAKLPILYAGALSCAVAYTLQIVAQKNVNPTLASLILSLESVFALLGEFVYGFILGRPSSLSSQELFGCAVVFCAIILAQLPDKKQRKNA
ncbi:MAG: DMT family transporter [Clostridia bacterium]|nr:DMT family transporter [Clostridia bacterium]